MLPLARPLFASSNRFLRNLSSMTARIPVSIEITSGSYSPECCGHGPPGADTPSNTFRRLNLPLVHTLRTQHHQDPHLHVFTRCYIGLRRIQSAVRQAKDAGLPLDFSLSFHPFLLDPTLPESPGENKHQRYVKRFGGEAKVRQSSLVAPR